MEKKTSQQIVYEFESQKIKNLLEQKNYHESINTIIKNLRDKMYHLENLQNQSIELFTITYLANIHSIKNHLDNSSKDAEESKYALLRNELANHQKYLELKNKPLDSLEKILDDLNITYKK
ncbi:MAG: hypothetical protein ACMXX9_04240 [Candidatus Woesearchaeota archaeon]